MKFQEYIIEKLGKVKIDSTQLYKLHKKELDSKTFAINCNINPDEAKNIQDIVDNDIVIVSYDDLLDIYQKDDLKKYEKHIDELISQGAKYPSNLDIPEDEDSEEINDASFIKKVISDIVGVDQNSMTEYFWKKSGSTIYIYFIINLTKDVEELIDQL